MGPRTDLGMLGLWLQGRILSCCSFLRFRFATYGKVLGRREGIAGNAGNAVACVSRDADLLGQSITVLYLTMNDVFAVFCFVPAISPVSNLGGDRHRTLRTGDRVEATSTIGGERTNAWKPKQLVPALRLGNRSIFAIYSAPPSFTLSRARLV